jgi:hypothetical protein
MIIVLTIMHPHDKKNEVGFGQPLKCKKISLVQSASASVAITSDEDGPCMPRCTNGGQPNRMKCWVVFFAAKRAIPC